VTTERMSGSGIEKMITLVTPPPTSWRDGHNPRGFAHIVGDSGCTLCGRDPNGWDITARIPSSEFKLHEWVMCKVCAAAIERRGWLATSGA